MYRRIDASYCTRVDADAFDGLGTAAWGERTRQESRAAGEASRARSARSPDLLSAQELEIARMAAGGLTNRQIGQHLYISPRTVGAHLYRIFPKLGITSRVQLGAALASSAAACVPGS
jgi:DNA-binding NarL/FixJ family response regulator